MEHKDNDHPDDDHPDDHPDDYEYQECQLCCEKTQMIIPCLNEPCDYIICDKCYSRIDDKCPACRTSLTEYKKDLIAEKIIIEIDNNEIDGESDTDTNPRRNSTPNTSPIIIYDITQFPNDISWCSVICILILLLTFPIIKFFELGGILIQKLIELNTYLSQYITYQRFKIFSSIVLFIFLFRTIGWVTLKSIENEEIQAYISYNYFDIFGFLLGFGIGIITILLFFGLSIIYFRSVLWVVLKITWLYKKMIRYLYPQDDQQQHQQQHQHQ